jgi:hypothetical protein
MNMKANKYLMGLVVALAGLTSCNTDVEGDYYSSDFANVSFDSKGTSVSLSNTETTATIPVRVTRAKTEGAYTATYTTEASAPGVFTESGNGTVSFADGEGSAIINVTAIELVHSAADSVQQVIVEIVHLQFLQRILIHLDGFLPLPIIAVEVGEFRGHEILAALMTAKGDTRTMLRLALTIDG